jgi:hypothetical protein
MTEMSKQGEGGGRVRADETVLDGENDFADWMEVNTGEKGV